MLSATAAEAAGPPNPFAPVYGALVSKASDALSLSLYFPASTEPRKPLRVQVKKDLSCEDVIGVGLLAYVDAGRDPALDVGEGEVEVEVGRWNLRIVEDNGEVDDDFPALDRKRPAGKFGFKEFAVVRVAAAGR